jgi:hypothetical protein
MSLGADSISPTNIVTSYTVSKCLCNVATCQHPVSVPTVTVWSVRIIEPCPVSVTRFKQRAGSVSVVYCKFTQTDARCMHMCTEHRQGKKHTVICKVVCHYLLCFKRNGSV